AGRATVPREGPDGGQARVGAQRVEGAAGKIEDLLHAEHDLKPRRDQEENGGVEYTAHQDVDEVRRHDKDACSISPSPRPLPRGERELRCPSPLWGEGRVRGRGRPGQIFQLLIHSISLEPAGFMAVLVDTTSIGLMVTKS